MRPMLGMYIIFPKSDGRNASMWVSIGGVVSWYKSCIQSP